MLNATALTVDPQVLSRLPSAAWTGSDCERPEALPSVMAFARRSKAGLADTMAAAFEVHHPELGRSGQLQRAFAERPPEHGKLSGPAHLGQQRLAAGACEQPLANGGHGWGARPVAVRARVRHRRTPTPASDRHRRIVDSAPVQCVCGYSPQRSGPDAETSQKCMPVVVSESRFP